MKELIRLNKFISHNSRFSRREADKLIQDGEVSIEGEVITDLATKVTEDTVIKVNGRTVRVDSERLPTVIVYNKQKGEIVSKKDPQGRRTIYDSLPKKFAHFIPIGRLDFTSEGVLLLTDDVKIANAMMHSDLDRIYKIKIAGEINDAMMDAMENGIYVEDATAGAHEKTDIIAMDFKPFSGFQIQKVSKSFSTLKVAISEGKNRELRRFFAHFEAPVTDLKRLDYGGITLNALPSGKNRYLDKKEYRDLRAYIKAQSKE